MKNPIHKLLTIITLVGLTNVTAVINAEDLKNPQKKAGTTTNDNYGGATPKTTYTKPGAKISNEPVRSTADDNYGGATTKPIYIKPGAKISNEIVR